MAVQSVVHTRAKRNSLQEMHHLVHFAGKGVGVSVGRQNVQHYNIVHLHIMSLCNDTELV